MSLAIDEYGRPFLLIREQKNRTRLKGTEAMKSNILAIMKVAETMSSSFGPKGMDKIIVKFSKFQITF